MNKFIPGLLLAAISGMSLSAAAYATNAADQETEKAAEDEEDAMKQDS